MRNYYFIILFLSQYFRFVLVVPSFVLLICCNMYAPVFTSYAFISLSIYFLLACTGGDGLVDPGPEGYLNDMHVFIDDMGWTSLPSTLQHKASSMHGMLLDNNLWCIGGFDWV